jgi:hypothetical protein
LGPATAPITRTVFSTIPVNIVPEVYVTPRAADNTVPGSPPARRAALA